MNSSKQKLNQLNTEFKKLAQLRLNQSHSLQDQWESYQTDTRQSRKKDIEKRQADFDKETQMDQIKNEEPIKKSEICSRLIHVLKNQDSIQIVNQNSDNGDIDTSVVILPNDILELFWFIGVNDIPVVQSELPLMISRLESLLK
ncbi:uncharacterized protein B0P05DRAFT_557122 [Gilbertella persicaria]|uniref:uncharacterized protein n=1 Tax=Gilbertella persicaria TaxID=101096 RepID=UPI0022200154|nr:uncharacterized protein B0P05DRAFT_557122 [Gilbertella persicaria]KAI8061888.1 hypothetical protein B0P05DRAFT_557122 [Gilbertella persicaria]